MYFTMKKKDQEMKYIKTIDTLLSIVVNITWLN